MTATEKQLEQLEEYFLYHTSFFLKDARNKLELAEALQDTDTATKEQSKLETMNAAREMFDDAKKEKTLEAVKQKYHELLETHRQQRQIEIEAAKASGDKGALVRAYIQWTVAGPPAHGLFHAAYKKVTGTFDKVNHE